MTLSIDARWRKTVRRQSKKHAHASLASHSRFRVLGATLKQASGLKIPDCDSRVLQGSNLEYWNTESDRKLQSTLIYLIIIQFAAIILQNLRNIL